MIHFHGDIEHYRRTRRNILELHECSMETTVCPNITCWKPEKKSESPVQGGSAKFLILYGEDMPPEHLLVESAQEETAPKPKIIWTVEKLLTTSILIDTLNILSDDVSLPRDP